MSTVEPKYWTPAALAKEAGVAFSTVHMWMREGRVKAKDFGTRDKKYRKMRIRDTEVQRVLKRLAAGLPL